MYNILTATQDNQGLRYDTKEKSSRIKILDHCARFRPSVKVNIKFRSPIVGMFVELGDAMELATKGMYRFVTPKLHEAFERNEIAKNTIILVGESIESIIKY